jgi:hypothetical protein
MKQARFGAMLGGNILWAVLGCKQSSSLPPDPVTELRQAVQAFTTQTGSSNVTFDANKTDSLVTPVTGIVVYDREGEHYRATFGYQDQKWKVLDVSRVVSVPASGGGEKDLVFSNYGMEGYDWQSALTKGVNK